MLLFGGGENGFEHEIDAGGHMQRPRFSKHTASNIHVPQQPLNYSKSSSARHTLVLVLTLLCEQHPERSTT